MTPSNLSGILAEMTPDGDGFTATVPANWAQGRTTYGGLTAALLLEAVQRTHPDLPPLRSVMINFASPVTATPRITTTLIRQGRNVTVIEARAWIDGQTAGLASFSFGAAQDSHIHVSRPGPDAPPPDQTPPLIPPQAERFAPGFHTNFDILLIEGDRPMMGSDRGYLRCWTRHKDPGSRQGLVSLLCMADILPPAVFPLFQRMGPLGTMTWMCNFMDPAPQTKDGWWQVETTASAAADGYSSQVMRVWNSDGDLVCDGMQSVLIFV